MLVPIWWHKPKYRLSSHCLQLKTVDKIQKEKRKERKKKKLLDNSEKQTKAYYRVELNLEKQPPGE